MDGGCQGLGSYSTYFQLSGAYRHSHQALGPFYHPMDATRHNRDISRQLEWLHKSGRGAPQRQLTDICLGHPGGAIPEGLEHSRGRDGVRRPEAISVECRRCHCLTRRHPGEHRTLPENVAVCITPTPLP